MGVTKTYEMLGFWVSLQTYFKHFADGLNMGCKAKTGSKCSSKFFGWSISKTETAMLEVGNAADNIKEDDTLVYLLNRQLNILQFSSCCSSSFSFFSPGTEILIAQVSLELAVW